MVIVILQSKKNMAATQYDYQKLYKGFCIRLKEDPNLKFSYYCKEVGVPWRRLYDWMSRRKISLKRLYAGVGRDLGSEISDYGKSQQQEKTFIPVKVGKSPEMSSPVLSDSISVCVDLPSGANMKISGCNTRDVVAILGGPLLGMWNV